MLFPFPLKLFPFPLVAPKLLPFPWESHGNPMGMGIPIPMHTSTAKLYLTPYSLQLCIPRTSLGEVNGRIDQYAYRICVQFLLIFYKAQNSSLHHIGLIEIYRQLRMCDVDQQTHNPALSAFEEQVLFHGQTGRGVPEFPRTTLAIEKCCFVHCDSHLTLWHAVIGLY